MLSPLLFTVYTNDCVNSTPCSSIIKYADDTAVVGKITNDNPEDYLTQVRDFLFWCSDNYLYLNVKKTKEMIVDFRINTRVPDTNVIANEEVERVEEYRYLGVVIDKKLTGSGNSQQVYNKHQQHIQFLRILRNTHIDQTILSLFYKFVVVRLAFLNYNMVWKVNM